MRIYLPCLILLAASAQAQLSGSVSSQVVAPGEVFTLTLNGEGSNIGTPVLPQTDDFQFMNADNPAIGKQTSMSFDGRRMRSSTTTSFTYQIHIDKEGKFTLPGISLTIDGKEYTTQPLEITCTKSGSGRRAPAQQSIFDLMNPFQRRLPPPATAADENIPFDDLVLFGMDTDKSELYVGEPLTVSIRYGQLNVGGVDARFEIPALKPLQGFFVSGQPEPLGDPIQKIGGRDYKTDGSKVVWFPTESGDFVLPGMEANVRVGRYTRAGWDTRVIVKKASPIAIKVKPLPPSPPEFSGAIGDIKLLTSIGAKELLQGSAVDFLITITGRANPAAISAPEIPELEWGHLSPPSNTPAEELPAGTLKIFKYTLTPLEDGEKEFPPLSLNYFSPSKGAYATTTAPAIKVNVRAAVQGAPVVIGAAPGAARQMAEIHPILHGAGNIGPQRSGWALNGIALVFPPVCYAACLGFIRRRRRLAEDTDYAREYFARSKSEKRLAGVSSAKDPTDALFRALAGFVADKLHVEEAGLTSADARREIAQRGLPRELAESVEKILRACERARYAGAQLSPGEIKALSDAAVQAMDQLELGLKGGGTA